MTRNITIDMQSEISYIHCWGKRVQQLKNVKSHVFLDFEKRKKNVKKRTYSFTGHLITRPLIVNYRKSVPVSHQQLNYNDH